jgi:hypothetical protein
MIIIKNQMRTTPIILIPQLDADVEAEEHIINQTIHQIQKKIAQDEDDAIVKRIMIHLILPVAAADAVRNPMAIPLPNHLVHDAAAVKNQHRLDHLQKTRVLEDLHHHNLPGEKDLNPILQEIIKIRSQEVGAQILRPVSSSGERRNKKEERRKKKEERRKKKEISPLLPLLPLLPQLPNSPNSPYPLLPCPLPPIP